MKQNLLLLLEHRKTGQIWLFSVLLSILLSEAIVVVMGLLLKGEVSFDYLLIGFVISFFVASLVVALLGFFLKQLSDSHLQLQTIIEIEPECVKLLAADGKVLQMNKAGLNMLEADSLSQVLGQSAQQLILSAYQANFEKLIKHVFEGQSGNLQFEMQGLKGTHRWLDTHAVPLRNTKGHITALLAITRDITRQKRAEAELRASEQKFRLLIEQIPLAVGLASNTGELLYINTRFKRTFGYTLEDVPTIAHWYKLAYPDENYRLQVVSCWNAAVEKAITQNTDIEPAEYNITCKNGEVRIMVIAGILFENSLLATFVDITHHKKTEKSLKESELMLKEAQEIAHLGHWTLDVPRNKLYWSDEIYRIFGVEPQEFEATYQAFLHYIHPDDREYVDYTYRYHLISKADYAIEHRVLSKNGIIKYVSEKCKTEFDANGNPLRSLGVVLDITDRKQAEEMLKTQTEALLRSNADLEQFAYSVSHDMRQPLRSIRGHLQLIARSLRDKMNEEEQVNLNFALDGAKRMDAMILSLLDYSRVGRKTESKTWLDSRAVLEEALEFLYPAIKDAKAEIKISGEWGQIVASQNELSRLLMNLIGNAIKYREKHQPACVEIHSVVTDTLWKVSVRDYGIGINPQQADRLFKFFSRLQSRTRFEGTGMGLALCRRIVELHHGKIWLESAGEGQGCCFIFELPLPKQGEQEEIEK